MARETIGQQFFQNCLVALSPGTGTFSIKVKRCLRFWSNIQLFRKIFKKIVCSKRSSFFENFLSLWYYKSYGFAIFAILHTIRPLGCRTAAPCLSLVLTLAPLSMSNRTMSEKFLRTAQYKGLAWSELALTFAPLAISNFAVMKNPAASYRVSKFRLE